MPSLFWGVVLLVLVPLLQVPAVFYLSRYVELEDGELLRAPEGTYVTYPGETAPREPEEAGEAEAAGDGTACRHCGADNDPEYEYCQQCAGQLA
jgi:ribosomal protein L40E